MKIDRSVRIIPLAGDEFPYGYSQDAAEKDPEIKAYMAQVDVSTAALRMAVECGNVAVVRDILSQSDGLVRHVLDAAMIDGLFKDRMIRDFAAFKVVLADGRFRHALTARFISRDWWPTVRPLMTAPLSSHNWIFSGNMNQEVGDPYPVAAASAACPPSLAMEARFIPCGCLFAASKFSFGRKPAGIMLEALALILLQQASMRVNLLHKVTDDGVTELLLTQFHYHTDDIANGPTGFGMFPVRIELSAKPILHSGAQPVVASAIDTFNPSYQQTYTTGDSVTAALSASNAPTASLSYTATRAEMSERVYKVWREEPVNNAVDASASSRSWVLQSLFRRERTPVDDLEFLGSVAKYFNGKLDQRQDGFDIHPDGSLGVTWSAQTWPRTLQWRTAVGDRVVKWDLTCTVITGFIGKGPLAGYNELRRFKAHAIIPVSHNAGRMLDSKSANLENLRIAAD